ncbi:hypothetical protein HID58_089363, partial [Brassica napus]
MRFLDEMGEQKEEELVRSQKRIWSKPPSKWVKCNFGVKWLKKAQTMGAARIVRDSDGEPLLHSRKSFINIVSLEEVKEKALAWTLECMGAHK